MPDRSLKPDELLKFLSEHQTGKIFIALLKLDEEKTEPSLYDLCLGELRAMSAAHANFIIQQGREINKLKERLGTVEEKL